MNAALGLSETELKNHCRTAAQAGKLVLVPGPLQILILPAVVETLKKQTLSVVARFHEQNPLLRGISREELRKRVYGSFPPEVFRFCLETLSGAKQISIQEDMVSAYGREVQLTPADLRIRSWVENFLRQAGYQPPSLAEISATAPADPADVRKICFWMLKEKHLIKIAEDLVYLRTTLDEMEQKIRDRYASGTRFGITEFKELFGLTRKYAIPLLEHFDREHFTQRQGNERILK
jgi:selenocysteine-specific elongation factor